MNSSLAQPTLCLRLVFRFCFRKPKTRFDPTQPPRYDPLRPEYGIRRDHVEIRAFWNPGTSLSIGGEGIWDLDGESSHVSAGVSWQPTATLRTAAEYRKLRTDQTAFLDFTFETGVNELWAAALNQLFVR